MPLPITPDQEVYVRQRLYTAGRQAQSLAVAGFQVDEKGPGDFVTTVDQALDTYLAEQFRAIFPGEALVTEEDAASRAIYAEGADRLWCIDPIDGTDDFIHGRPHYALMVGLLENYQPRAGWVYAPMLDRFYFGGPGWGLYLAQDGQVTELKPQRPDAAVLALAIGYKDRKRFGAALVESLPGVDFTSLGSFGLKVLEVVQGRAAAYVYLNRRVKVWDTAGPIALAQAAGLVCCDLEGRPLGFRPEDVDLASLAHRQTILIGWPESVEHLRHQIGAAVASVV